MTKAFKKRWEKVDPFGRSTSGMLVTFNDGGKMVIIGEVPKSKKAVFWYQLYNGKEFVKKRYSYDDVQNTEKIVVAISAKEWYEAK